MADETEASDPTPQGSAKRWTTEFGAARQEIEPFHKSAGICNAQYRDESRDNTQTQKLNLYPSGVDLKEATLYGNVPTVDVERRNNDQEDDDARVAADILRRVLNGDLERTEDGFPGAIGLALKDWLVPGMGMIWHRFTYDTEEVPEQPAKTEPVLDEQGQPVVGEGGAPQTKELAAMVPATTRPSNEDAATDFIFYKDLLWSPCRVFPECRWFAKVARLSGKTFKKKFGDHKVPFAVGADPKDKTVARTPWARIEVWEIWEKDPKACWYFVEGYSEVLVPLGEDGKPLASNPDGSIADPLGLSTFWPFPEPLMEGLTNAKYLPRPSYTRAQDQYTQVNTITTRIGVLVDAIDASCVYDKTVGELGQLLDTHGQNKAIPAVNYLALAEKGGIANSVMWKPLEPIIAALDKLRDLRREEIDLLFQVDGTSDIQRGQATEAGATATEQAIKAKYGSIRGGKAQKRFASFASDGQRIRAEIICKHFSVETIALRANVRGLPQADQARVPNALALLKSDVSRFRISVKPESVSLTDFAANKQESMDVLGTIGKVAKMIQGVPAPLVPGLLKLAQVALSRIKGGDEYESVLDEMVEQVEQMAQQAAATPPAPDPKLQAEQVKLEAVKEKAQAEGTKAQLGVMQTVLDTKQAAAEHQQSMQALEAEVRADALKAAGAEVPR